MDIRVESFRDNCVQMSLDGRLVMNTLENFKEQVEDVIQKDQYILFDFSHLEMIDSTSIGYLFLLYKRGMRDSIWIGILDISDTVRSIFEITGLDNLFTITYSLPLADEAIVAFDLE